MKNSKLVDFYSHSHNHYFLPELTPVEIAYEISHSIELIKSNIINQETDIFCYPSGRYNDTVINILKKNHVEYALDRQGGCLKGKIGKYRVPRIPLHDDISYSEALFRLQLSKS